MRRSFRAATVFTGTAAIAGGFGPTALAATARPAFNSITNVVCGANNGGLSHWVHLFYPNNDHPAECFGREGDVPAKATIASLCPGNNNGSIAGSVDTFPDAIPLTAGAGRHPISHFDHILSFYWHLSRIYIGSWTGTAKCT